MGRTKVFKQPVTTTFRLEKEEYDEIDKIRWREHDDLGSVVRKAVQDYIKIHAAGNETFKITDFEDPGFKAMPATMSSKDQWNEYIRKHMDKKERRELGERAKFMLTIIEAANWIENKNVKIPDSS